MLSAKTLFAITSKERKAYTSGISETHMQKIKAKAKSLP
jgi:hypothetical protein